MRHTRERRKRRREVHRLDHVKRHGFSLWTDPSDAYHGLA